MLSRLCASLFLFLVLFLAIAATGNAATPYADVFNGAEINWRDPKSGIYEASKTGKPVIMVFHASWCPACKRYREVFKDNAIVAASKSFVMILVDADREKEINGAFAPDGAYVPRTMFIDSEGNVSATLVGKDPQYPHTLDIERPDELLLLMNRAKAFGLGTTPDKQPDEKSAPATTEERT